MMKEPGNISHKITGGVYLVLDPAMEREKLMDTLHQALKGGVQVLQIWNHWPSNFTMKQKAELTDKIVNLAEEYGAPVLINEEWELLKTTRLHGLHFDKIPPDISHIKTSLSRPFLLGVTCSNNLDVIEWANRHQADYISFCSMFPSVSAGNCEIVRPETVQKARERTRLPLFVSGGVTPQNLRELTSLGINGVAVISGILGSESPEKTTANYKKALHNK